MARNRWLSVFSGALMVLASAVPARADSPQAAAPTAEAVSAAVKASPDLIGALSKELGSTPEQAAGAAGALFGLAKSRLAADQFSQVANAVPGMDSLLSLAPAMSAVGTGGALAKATGAAGGLASAASAFSKLGLKPEMVSKAIPILTSFVTKSGGASVGNLLAGVLK